MIHHLLKIGQRIYDCCDERWGVVLLICNENKDRVLTEDEEDMIILYRPDDSDGECETMARDCYPLIPNCNFWGNDVCLEINRDKFDLDHDYDYYCPERDENCWASECE